jgi:hypothetical protein
MEIGYILAGQGRMICYRMSFQLIWNHSIVTKFFLHMQHTEESDMLQRHTRKNQS